MKSMAFALEMGIVALNAIRKFASALFHTDSEQISFDNFCMRTRLQHAEIISFNSSRIEFI